MLSIFVGIVARCAITIGANVGAAFILSRAVPRNKAFRFVFWFVLCVPLNWVINYTDAAFLGYDKMGWTGTLTLALLVAICGTFWPLPTHNSDTP
jgi:hypothetical protein